ncbi:MAG TPA: TonB family protein [Solirubrobacteraceae bacterium]|jgi:protein TonB|nr:TonB family protein [Solirubrobacteraceae bacterium]
MARRALTLREGRPPAWDRLLAMVFFVGLLHGLVILGITFNAQAGDEGGAPGLKVLLVSDELPEADKNPTATYLAQRTQLGSGNTREPVPPHSPPTALPALKHAGSPQGDSLAMRGDMKGAQAERVLATTAWVTDVSYLADLGSTGSQRDRPLLIDEPPAAQPGPEDEPGPAQLAGPRRDELWVTADTRAASLAPYLDAWRRKVERVGTLNFPVAARTALGSSSPVVEVGINADGTLDRAVIRRSSGNPELDQAALAILKLASPFDPFPPELAAEHGVLRFAYEWQFVGGRMQRGSVSARP